MICHGSDETAHEPTELEETYGGFQCPKCGVNITNVP